MGVAMLRDQSVDAVEHKVPADWRKAGTSELISHILERFHARHREQLPQLIALAQQVERVHAAHSQCPRGLASHLMEMEQELLSHMMKEEQVLFPMLKNGMRQKAGGPISVMEMDHTQHLHALEEMLSLTHQLVPPADACSSWKALYTGLSELQSDLMEHIHLENDILFKQTSNASGMCCGQCGGA